MAKGKGRTKAIAAKRARKAQLAARYKAEAGEESSKQPNPDTPFGRRWHKRRRGEGMSLRTHEGKPWWDRGHNPLSAFMGTMGSEVSSTPTIPRPRRSTESRTPVTAALY